jgi:uncharacterized membrane protein
MAKDLQDQVRDAVTHAARGAVKSAPKPGAKGVAAGVGALALTPLAVKGIGKLAHDGMPDGLTEAPSKAAEGLKSKVGETISGGIGDRVSDKLDDAGGPGGMLKKALGSVLPFGGNDDDDEGDGGDGIPGVGKGRRMPVQQSVDIGAPLETVYNHWTQFEEWPKFMHRVKRVTQEDRCTVSFQTKIWGKTKEFKAQIVTQRPDERIKWRVTEGMTHTGVVTFHELAPNLTRVLLGLDVDPGGLLEKAARGMRHVKRAARGDLHRFKAYIEAIEQETGAWRGTIEDGKVVRKREGRRESQNGGRRSQNGSSGGRSSSDGGRSRSRGH